MFVKKSQAVQMPKVMQQKVKEQMRTKELNHQFFLLVRDKKYEEAYVLGMAYLQYFPQNTAIQKFCYFIKHNQEELLNMVDEEQNYTDDSQEESEQDEDQQDDQYDNQSLISQKSSVKSLKSSVSSAKSIISLKNQVNTTVQNKANAPVKNQQTLSKPVNSTKSISSSSSLNQNPPKQKQNKEDSNVNKWSSICKNVYNEKRKNNC